MSSLIKNPYKALLSDIAASLFICPASEEELLKREFLKNKSREGVQRMLMRLERDALFIKDGKMHINKHWAKKNLKGYNIF